MSISFLTISFFALGANQTHAENDLTSTLTLAVKILSEDYRFSIPEVSPYYDTPAWPPGNGPDFINAAGTIESDLAPAEILRIFHEVEERMGRERPVRWAPRVIDIDLLATGATVLPDSATVRDWITMPDEHAALQAPDRLILPHPRLHERAFVLVPLSDIAPDWVHPVLGRSVSEMLADLPAEEVAQVRRRPSTRSSGA